MFRLALIVFFVFLALWPLSRAQKYFDNRDSNFRQIDLTAQNEVQKRLVSGKQRALEILYGFDLKEKLLNESTHSMKSILKGKVTFPDTELFAVANTKTCTWEAGSKNTSNLPNPCQLADANNKDIFLQSDVQPAVIIQTLPVLQDQSSSDFMIAHASVAKLNWILGPALPLKEKYQLTLSSSSGIPVSHLESISQSLAVLKIRSSDWISSSEWLRPILNKRFLEKFESFIYLLAVLALGFILRKYYKENKNRNAEVERFHGFLKRELGLNIRAAGGSYLDSWLNALRNVDVRAQDKIAKQKKEIAELKSKHGSVQAELKRLQSDTAHLMRFKNVQTQLQRFGHSMDHLNQNLIEQKHPKWIDRLARTKWCQQNDKEIFDRWQQGFDEEGMRRFLRRMMERETINGTTELDFDFACLKQSNVESRAHIDYLENELKSLKGTISHLQSNCSLLVNATSNDTDSQTTLEPKLIEKTVREILTYDFDKNINLVFSGQGEFAVSVEQAVIYPICMTISQLALETFNLPKSDAAVSCQCKHKLTKDTHYFVVLLKPKIPCNVKQNSFEENMSLIERLLSPVRIKSQIIDIDRTRLVMSFSWSEKLKNNEKSKQRRSTAELNL